jgi:hypothetical protein
MIDLTRTLTITAAMLVLGAGAAYSQDVAVATIPFPFQVRGTTLPAGDYTIQRASMGSSVLRIQGSRGKAGAFVLPKYRSDGADANPHLTFRCTESDCFLTGLSSGLENWEFDTPRLTSVQKERLAAVYLHQTKVQQ